MPEAVNILVVEDEFLIQELIKDALVEAGYEPHCEDRGQRALKALDGSGTFAGLVTDVRLADDVSGWEVAHHARAANREIAVIYISGDSGGDYSVEGVPGSTFIQKPFAEDQIVTAISTLLNGSRD